MRRFRLVSLPLTFTLLFTALGLLTVQSANATTNNELGLAAPTQPVVNTNDGGVVWCLGDGSAYNAVSGYTADTAPDGLTANPADTADSWRGNAILTNDVSFGDMAETGALAAPYNNDRYAIQLNYWDSVTSNAGSSIGYSTGNSCALFYYNQSYPNVGQFTITYPATPSQPAPVGTDTVNEQAVWANLYPNAYPWYGNANFFYGSTDGGPTGYVSTFKGCSWDANSCTPLSKVLTVAAPTNTSTDWNSFPQLLSAITSIPSTWNIEFNPTYGNPKDGVATWDASYDIWFDKTAQTGVGQAACPGCSGRGQNDGLEIMVWMNSGHSYVDTGSTPLTNQTGYAQPSGWPRETVLINGVYYDVWTSRLNNPYFGYAASTGNVILAHGAEPYTCSTLPIFLTSATGGSTATNSPGAVCGTDWNVVSFVATKDGNGTDNRQISMSMDSKVFTDYILGIEDGLYTIETQSNAGNRLNVTPGTYGQLACPTSSMDKQQDNPVGNPSACLSQNWWLTSVQAGFEPWIGGNGLQSDSFQAHVLTSSTAVQSGITSDTGTPVVNWQDPFLIVYSGCTTNSSSNHAGFYIQGTNSQTGATTYFPNADGSSTDMGTQLAGTNLFEYTINAAGAAQLYPIHGPATIYFTSACGATSVNIFIDPSGHVFYSDGKTPVVGARVTLQYSPSGSATGPFVAVPNHNQGVTPAVMQPNDNTLNWMPSTKTGGYAWNVAPGYYQVSATKTGCTTVTSAVQHVVTVPVENLNINLTCAPPPPLSVRKVSPPTAPKTLTATAASSSQINLSWSAVPLPPNATSVTYTVNELSPKAAVIASGLTATTYSVTGLTANTAYTFDVTAVDTAGASAGSPAAKATTQAGTSGNCHVTYTVTSAKPGIAAGLTVNISIQNTGKTAIYPWTLGWTFPGNQKITYVWNVKETQTGAAVTMSSLAAWESIAAGATLTNQIGFNGNFTGTNTNPTAFTLNGLACQ